MRVRELAVHDAYEFTPDVFPDHRGTFVAPFQQSMVDDRLGYPMQLAQINHNVSRRGAIRGVHFTDVPPGQAKYVFCSRGALLDVVVDLRVGSPTFGHWDAVRLDTVHYRAVYLAEGLGHACMALEDGTAMVYLCSTEYQPARDHGISPCDPELGLPWPDGLSPVLSDKDAAGPTLAQALASGVLPRYADCIVLRDEHRYRSEQQFARWEDSRA
jgi:dTDP-4-dehydrorhamnose 3,5-epimerase